MTRQLNTVLTIRRRAEDEALRNLAVAESMAQAAHLEVESATTEARRPVDGEDSPSFTVSHDLSSRRGERRQRAVEQATVADAITEAARATYSAARVQTEIISKLLEKKAIEAREHALVADQKQLDDATSALWARDHA
jgi:flagellar biosynthesis chaperone FliJ